MVILDTNIIIDHLRQTKDRQSHLLKLAKVKPKEVLAIAATAVINGAQLLTLNKKDFADIKDLDLV